MIAGLVLAAGAGIRFDARQSKLLADLHGRPLLEYAVAAQTEVRLLERVVVVLGARAEEIRSRVDFGRAETVACDDWMLGQSASLRCGAAALRGAEKVIVTLGDVPLISASLIARFVDEPHRTRALYKGRPGHPVVLGPDELLALQGLDGDSGAKELLAGGRVVECGDEASGMDIDTWADLDAVRLVQAGIRAGH